MSYQGIAASLIHGTTIHCIGFDDIERDIKRRPFSMKTREFKDPPGDTNPPPKKFSHVDRTAPEFLQAILGNHF